MLNKIMQVVIYSCVGLFLSQTALTETVEIQADTAFMLVDGGRLGGYQADGIFDTIESLGEVSVQKYINYETGHNMDIRGLYMFPLSEVLKDPNTIINKATIKVHVIEKIDDNANILFYGGPEDWSYHVSEINKPVHPLGSQTIGSFSGEYDVTALFSIVDFSNQRALSVYMDVDVWETKVEMDNAVLEVTYNETGTPGDGDNSLIGESCGINLVYDCVLNCVDEYKTVSWVGDNYCDDGQWGVVLTCPTFNNDGGDCNSF